MHYFILLLMVTAVWPCVTAAGVQQQAGGAELIQTIDFKGAGGCPGLRLGDINGDGKYEIVMGQPVPQSSLDAHTPQEVVRITAYNLTGEVLWQYTRPDNQDLSGHTASSDIPIQVYDLDGDGTAEVLADFGRREMTVLNGIDGSIKRTIPLPQGTSARGPSGSNDCIIIANLRGTEWPQDFIVKTRYTQIWGIDGRDGTVLWTCKGAGDNLCHFGYAFNADDDPMDEYISGWQLLDHDGDVLWRARNLTMHIDAVTVGDLDDNPDNGPEVILGSQVGVAYRVRTGEELWRDNSVTANGQGIQHIAMGDYDTSSEGKEVAMLERIGPRNEFGRDANIIVSSEGDLIWKENRTGNDDYGWLTVTERITNWEGDGRDQILSYRRTFTGPAIYTERGEVVATFDHPGENIDFIMHADLCGDDREEVIVYNETTAWIYSNGGCDLSEPPPGQPSLPQNRRLYNWTIYSGWEAVDYTFYTPGSTGTLDKGGRVRDAGTKFPGQNGTSGFHQEASVTIFDLQGKVLFKGKWNGREALARKLQRGICIISAVRTTTPHLRKIIIE